MNSGCGTEEEEEEQEKRSKTKLWGAGIWGHCDDGDAPSA